MVSYHVDAPATDRLLSSSLWCGNPAVVVVNDDSGERSVVVACRPCNGSDGVHNMVMDEDLCFSRKWYSITVTREGYTPNVYRAALVVNEEGMSVDHINCVRLDNRRKNLRQATRWDDQAANRDVISLRADRKSYDDIARQLEIEELPRFIRWDHADNKFTFKDHPIFDIAARHGISINPSGTKSGSVTYLDKFRSCLLNLLDAFEKVQI